MRPPQKFFNYRDVEGAQLKYANQFNKRLYYWNRNYYRRGFIYKYFNFKALDYEGVVPPKDVFHKFLRPDDEDDSQPSESEDPDEEIENWKRLAAENLSLSKGDKVKVVNGDLKNLTGTVISVDKSIIKMKPDHKEIKQNLDLDLKMLAKHFEAGDHVCVIEGDQEGEKGIIIKTSGNKCIIFSDLRKKEFFTLSNNLKLSSQVNMSITNNIDHGYNVYDLIMSNKRSVGVVLSTEKNTVRIINENSEIETIEVTNISNKIIQKKNISTLDNSSNFVSLDNTVVVVEGKNKGVKGLVKYIYQNSVFLYNKDFFETLGIFVEMNRNVVILGSKALQRSMNTQNTKKRDPLLNKVVTICKGEFKGFDAKVVDVTDRNVRLELFSKSKVISIAKIDVIEKGKIKDEQDYVKPEPQPMASKTPAYRPNSPGWALNTPVHLPSPDWRADSAEEE